MIMSDVWKSNLKCSGHGIPKVLQQESLGTPEEDYVKSLSAYVTADANESPPYGFI